MKEIDEVMSVKSRAHSIVINNREKIMITGVNDMDSFNESEVIVLTDAGFLTVSGTDLHINKLNLDEGQLIIDGTIQSVDYSDHEELRQNNSSIFSKVFNR